MTEIRTRDDALAAVDRGLAQWATAALGVFTQATAVISAACASGESQVQRLRARVAALEALLRSLRPEDDPRPLERELAQTRQSLASAQRATQQIAALSQQLHALQRAQSRSNDTNISAARADLTRRVNELGAYRGPGSGSGSSGTASTGAPSGAAWLNGTGLSEVAVGAADFEDNPIVGSFGRGGTSLADYRWAVQTWDEVVRPGVERGMTRADFEARDSQRAATGLRRTAGVYDMFLGDSDRLLVTRRPDGSLDVTNGRHRFEVARQLGITHLPAQVHDL